MGRGIALREQAEQEKEQQICEGDKKQDDEGGWKSGAAQAFQGEHNSDPDERQSGCDHDRQKSDLVAVQLGDAGLAQGGPVVEQRPGLVEEVRGDEAVDVVLDGEAENPEQGIGRAIHRAGGSEKLSKGEPGHVCSARIVCYFC